jgi:hypothetical protein
VSIAPDGNDAAGVFHIVHPFHPLCGQPLLLVTIRRNSGEDMLYYYHDPKGVLVSVPVRWTDRVAPDPVVTVSAGRSPFRLEDLLELARLVAAREQEASHDR